MRDRVAVLVNPTAGDGHGLDRWTEIERALSPLGEIERIAPLGEHGLAAAVRDATSAGALIVVAGGDGTVNRVVNALDGHRGPIGVLPVGSGNDLARALGLPRDPVKAAGRIACGTAVAMDLVEVNGRRFCTVGGLGLVSEVTMRVVSLAQPGRWTRAPLRRLGPHGYLLATVARLASPRRIVQQVAVRGDGPQGPWSWEGTVHALFVANQPTLGAGLALPVEASASDGVCEVCLVPRRSRGSLVTKLVALRTGRPQPEDVLTVRRATHATIEMEHVVPFAADGDVLCLERRFEVVVRPAALLIRK